MDPIEGIVERTYRTRNRMLRWGLLVLLMGITSLILMVFVLPLSPKGFLGLGIFTAFLLISGIYLLVLAGTILHPAKHPVIKQLRHGKHQIVWVYSFININRPFGVELFKLVTIWLHYRDGSQQHLRIGFTDLEPTMENLQNMLPHATFGYSVQKEQLYRANPALLERE